MKIIIDGISVFEETFDTTDSIVDCYRDEEVDHGREVPRYSWETLALLLGGWLLKKVADELFKWVVEYRKRARDRETENHTETIEERHHNELLQKLDKLISVHERREDDVLWLRSMLSEKRLAIGFYFDTDAEADLIPAFEQHLADVRESVVLKDARV